MNKSGTVFWHYEANNGSCTTVLVLSYVNVQSNYTYVSATGIGITDYYYKQIRIAK